METKVTSLVAASAAILLSLHSCLVPVPAVHEPAVLRLSVREDPQTRGSAVPMDIADYTLTLIDARGKTLFHDKWEACPDEFELDPGSYTVSLMSDESTEPAYDHPLFGDSRGLTLAEGQVSEVTLVATQLNSGLRLLVSDAFIANYKEGALFLRCATGTLAFGYAETRTAFFLPGKLAILLNINGKTVVVHNMELRQGEILTLRLGVAEQMPKVSLVSGVDMYARVDTTRVWSEETLSWDGSSAGDGGGSPGTTPDAVSVSTARGMAGKKDVWVQGYIVGGDLTSTKCSFEGPFSSRANLVLADKADCRDRDICMSVQLSTGDIRNALNLVDNPSMLGRKVILRGDIVEAYYRLPGLQNLSDYRL
ncbi:MAG: DUF4493 domain-containing protein [Bacteroidales bacterium]|nr:DUF4493 domain-containing protein [Bacteroidales bacterium]